MDSITVQNQEVPVLSLENMILAQNAIQAKRPRPQPEQSLQCPRCESMNTKFCYYNNYSLSQPRYFCKSCRRYWTKGGTLRNIPVGGGSRKSKKTTSSSSSTSKRIMIPQLDPDAANHLPSFPPFTYESNDIGLVLARLQTECMGELGFHSSQSMSALGDSVGAHCDLALRNGSGFQPPSTSQSLLNALKTEFLETQTPSLQNCYFGYENLKVSDSQATGHSFSCPIPMPLDAVGLSAGKEEPRDQVGMESNRVLWGFPWQMSGDPPFAELDSGREYWNGSLESTWTGLLNSSFL